ncbi:MAG: ABC transporter substrate-binding protein [Croceibacterium sp.]
MAALLVPKTGQHAALGRSMERAALMAQAETDKKSLLVFDTGGTAAGAAAAARAARKAGVAVILGPVFAAETVAVLTAVAGAIPVISFSNDAALLERGAFLLGITARQVVTGVLTYAARRGVMRVAVSGPGDDWGKQARTAALAIAPGLGLTVTQLPDDARDIVLPVGASGSADGLPDALLMTSAGSLAAIAPAAAAQGIQLLAATPALDFAPEILGRIEGAWVAAPEPARVAGFARQFEDRNGSAPGTITVLAYDAVRIVGQARVSGGVDRSALLVQGGFKGISGDIRFRDDGSAARTMAILAVVGGALRTVAPAPTA